MSPQGLLQFFLLLMALAVTAPALGRYIAKVHDHDRLNGSAPGDRFFLPVERWIYRVSGIDSASEQRWNVYALALLAFSAISFLFVYLVQRIQGSLPINPTGVVGVRPLGAFNVAVSFVTNTNWQWYGGEGAMSHLTQFLALSVQNFVSCAAGLAICVALIRGIARSGGRTLGNFWVDLVRSTLRILLPLSLVCAFALAGAGVVQNFHGYTSAKTIDATVQVNNAPVAVQRVPGGPVASQEAIKQLGTNGGGFYNANSAHPFENPNAISNFLELYLIVLIPIALCFTYGAMVRSKKQGTILLAVMMAIWIATTMFTSFAETGGNPQLTKLGVDQSVSALQSGGNTEGKELRFSTASCAQWAAATTGTSNGSVNCMHDSFTPLGGGLVMIHMMLGEVSPGGVGVGLMGILMNALLAVFIAGLMVGRTPEYLGKKIQAAEMKLVVLYILAMPLALLGFAAATVLLASPLKSLQTADAHGLSEVLYNYASAANNNGSAFAYMGTGTDWYTTTQGISMLIGRFFLIIPALAIGGSLVRKRQVPVTSGTFATDNGLFAAMLLGVVIIIAGLTFFPALALGPILEHFSAK
jgi:potassium-transporting ATPase potassium-binding subunit